jgi:hypothetical protein
MAVQSVRALAPEFSAKRLERDWRSFIRLAHMPAFAIHGTADLIPIEGTQEWNEKSHPSATIRRVSSTLPVHPRKTGRQWAAPAIPG